MLNKFESTDIDNRNELDLGLKAVKQAVNEREISSIDADVMKVYLREEEVTARYNDKENIKELIIDADGEQKVRLPFYEPDGKDYNEVQYTQIKIDDECIWINKTGRSYQSIFIHFK